MQRRSFLQSVWVEVLNPQTLVLFITQLPRFVEANEANPTLKLVILGTLLNMTGSLGDLAAMACSRLLCSRLSEKMVMMRKVQFGGGSLLIGLGMHILLPSS